MSEQLKALSEKMRAKSFSFLSAVVVFCILLTPSDTNQDKSKKYPSDPMRSCNTLFIPNGSEKDIQSMVAQLLQPELILASGEPANPEEVILLFQISPEIAHFRLATFAWFFVADYGADITIMNHTENINSHPGDIETMRILLVKINPHQYQIVTVILYPHGEPQLVNLDQQCYPDELYASLKKHALYASMEICNQTKLWIIYQEVCNQGPVVYPHLTADYNVGGPEEKKDPLLTVPELLTLFNGNSAWDRHFCGDQNSCGPEAIPPWIETSIPGNVASGYGQGWKISLPSLIPPKFSSALEIVFLEHQQ